MRVLVTGAGGQVGSEVVGELNRRGEAIRRGPALEVLGATHGDLDITKRDLVLSSVLAFEPDVIIHAGAFTAVDRCETEPDLAYAVNAMATRHLAEAARLCGAHLAYVSTDYVFDGSKPSPYHEWDTPNPLSVYGRSKLGGELEAGATATVVRTSWVCGRSGSNMVKTVLGLVAAGRAPLRFVADQHGCPTVASDLAGVLVDLALARQPGRFHVTNAGPTSWYEFVQAVVSFAGGDPSIVEPIATSELDPPRPAPRPANSVLDNLALRLLGRQLLEEWHAPVERLVAELLAAR